jgi:O-antigen/teichoic acid export membrane protein
MIAICISIMATGLFYIGRFLHISFFENFPSPIILFISTVATAAFTIAVNIANRIKKYGLISIANTINGASQAIIRIIFGIFPVVINGLIWGNIIAHILGFLFIISILLAYLKHFEWRSLSFDVIKGIAYKYKKFPLYDAPAKFIEFTVSNIVIIILSFYFGQDEIGCFSMIMQFILLPVTVIGAAMGNVYYKDLSENQNDRVKIAQSTIKVGKITLYLAIIPIVFLALGGDKLFVLFLGQGWSNAGLMALCLSIYSVPVILTQPLLPAFRTLNRQELRFKYNIINLVSSILILCVVSKVFDNIYISLISYSIASAFVRFCIYFSIMKITDVKLKHISKYALYVIFIPYIILMLRLIIKL